MIGCRLLFGSLDLTAGGTGGYKFSVLADDADFGSPVPVETAIQSLLQDGSLTSTTSYDNRTTTFVVKITAIDGGALAAGERALALETGKRNSLVWYPPGGFVQPTRFQVVTSSLTYEFDDMSEIQLERVYRLKCEALPFGQSLNSVTTSASGLSAATTLDTCDAVGGWSIVSGGNAADITADATIKYEGSASVKCGHFADAAVSSGFYTYYYSTTNQDTVTPTVPYSTGAGSYMSVWVQLDSTYSPSGVDVVGGLKTVAMTSTGAGTQTFSPVAVETATGGWVRYAWPVNPGLTVTKVVFTTVQYWASAIVGRKYVHYDLIGLSATGAAKRLVHSLDIRGSARTPGSLIVQAPGTALGEVFACSFPEDAQPLGFAPDCRRYYTGSSTVADTAAINGTAITGSASFDVPLTTFNPGTFQVIVRANHTTANPVLTVTAQLYIGGVAVGSVMSVDGTPIIASGGTSEYAFMSIGFIGLPQQSIQAPGSTAVVRLTVPFQNGMTRIDDVYIAPVDAAVSVIDCGTGAVSATGASSYLWIDAPSIDQPGGGWWRGVSADRTNAVSAIPTARALGRHLMTPPRMRAFVTSPAAGLSLYVDYVPQWFTHAWGE